MSSKIRNHPGLLNSSYYFTDDSGVWYPKEKIMICKQKLNGINSAYITGYVLVDNKNTFGALNKFNQVRVES